MPMGDRPRHVPHAQSPLSLSALLLVLRDAEHLTARYGSTSAACARLDELERAHGELQAQVATLQQKLNMAVVAAAAAQVDQAAAPSAARAPPVLFDVDALLGFLQHHCACRGSLALLQPVLADFQRSFVLPPDTRFPTRDVLLSVQEIGNVTAQEQPHQSLYPLHASDGIYSMPPSHTPMLSDVARKKKTHDVSRLTPKSKTPGSATSSPARPNGNGAPRLIAPAGRPTAVSSPQVDRRTHQEENQAANAAFMLSALSRPASGGSTPSATGATNGSSATPAETSPPPAPTATTQPKPAKPSAPAASRRVQTIELGPPKKKRVHRRQDDADADRDTGDDDSDSAASARKRAAVTTEAPAPPENHEVVVKQNLSLPHDKRNIVELKQSSMFLSLENLDELNQTAPWDEVYKLRSTFSHVLDYTALEEPARKWYIGALRIQFVWRREFWERLHWLPMSEAVCSGATWDKYRQTRKRRANKAIAAWRKVYSDSLELMRQRLLPEDVWCDVSLWYMPSTPLYWLPTSTNLVTELAVVDAKHPVRCYFVKDFRKHPFYNDDDIQRKYPHRYELPPPQLLALQNEDKESRVNFTPE